MFSRPKILFLVSLLFVALLNSNPYLPFEIFNFFIILVHIGITTLRTYFIVFLYTLIIDHHSISLYFDH